MVHYVANLKHLSVGRGGEVLPVKVVVRNSVVHNVFWSVAEASFGNDSVSTVRVLARLLKVEDCSHPQHLHLLYDIVLLDQPIAKTLGPNYKIFNPFRMQAFDGRIITLLPIFMLAPLSHAPERAMDPCDMFEVPRF